MKTAMDDRKGWKQFVLAENRPRSTRGGGGGTILTFIPLYSNTLDVSRTVSTGYIQLLASHSVKLSVGLQRYT